MPVALGTGEPGSCQISDSYFSSSPVLFACGETGSAESSVPPFYLPIFWRGARQGAANDDHLVWLAQFANSPSSAAEDQRIAELTADLREPQRGDHQQLTPVDYDFTFSGVRVVLGRFRLMGATGPEVSALSLPLYLERWSGTAFITDTASADATCTAVNDVLPDSPTGNLSPGKTTATVGAVTQGARLLGLSAPGMGSAGSIRVVPQVPQWLYFDWLGTGATNPSAIATFGGFQGARPLIFRREVYR